MKITVTIKDGKAYISTPYSREFVAKIKRIGGAKWDADSKRWAIPADELDIARRYMLEVYGETDLPDEEGKITVDVKFLDTEDEICEGITLFGRTIVQAWGRDTGAKVCDDVTLIDGSVRSGGSRANWRTIIDEGTVLRIKNLTRAALQLETEYDIEVKEVTPEGADKEALMAEKEKLLARLAEIEALLK